MSEPTLAPVSDLGRRRQDAIARQLTGVALFDGLDEAGMAGLAPAFTRIELAPNQLLWEQATPYDGLYVLLGGQVQVCRRLPGERELELARLGPGEVMGELPLLGGGTHSASVRALGDCSLLFLSAAEFEARTLTGETAVLQLRQRIAAIACARMRRALGLLAGPGPIHEPRDPQHGERIVAAMPPRSYVSRLALLRRLEPALVDELLDRGTVLYVPRGHVLQREGTAPERCCVTLNGAVEDVLQRDGASLRVGFAGPGRAFGYLGLLDGQPAPVSSVARERSLVLAIDPEHFEHLWQSRGPRVRAFAAEIEADVIRSLEVAERALSHLATARPA